MPKRQREIYEQFIAKGFYEVASSHHVFYRLLRKWFTIIALGLILEVIVAITALLMDYINLNILLPSIVEVPTIDLATIITNAFTATITINGIILGFFAICIIYQLEEYNKKISLYDELLSKKKGTQRKLKIEKYEIQMVRGDYAKYSEIYVKLSVFLMLLQVVLFSGSYLSGTLALISLILNLNTLLIVGSGLYAFLHSVFGVYFWTILLKKTNDFSG